MYGTEGGGVPRKTPDYRPDHHPRCSDQDLKDLGRGGTPLGLCAGRQDPS